MAEIIAPILNIVSVFFSCSANNRCFYLLDLQENKEELNNALVDLRATRADVKRRVDEVENNPNELMKRTDEVDNWLQRMQTIDVEVVQVIQRADQEIQGRCLGGNCPKNCWSARKIGKLVLQKLSIVKDHRSKGNSFGEVAYKLPPPSVQEEPTNTIVGMESMFDEVWRLLAEDEVRIMGLYGYGGVGKTTLLKQINNAFLEPTTTNSSSNTHGFDVVILVVVSKVIDIVAIQNEIGDRLGLSSPDGRSIFNALKKKSFVLLLDDIWDRVDLQSIGVPPPSENNKSKVVFTTRSEVVCGLMEANEIFKVECLPWNEAWSLFEGKVGERALKSFPRARELAEVVARECGGLPLALITIGRAMAAKKTLHEWEDAITTLQKYASKFPGMDKEVLPILKVSYDYLGDDMIKSCFLYCALYPEDLSMNKAKLIDCWIGEGLISLSDFNHIDEARNHGHKIIGILKGASLLESGGDEETQVKMHDTIRDLSLWIAHDCGNKMFIIKTSHLTTPERSDGGGEDETILTKLRKILIDIFKSLKSLRLFQLPKLTFTIDTSDLTPERSSSSSSWYNDAERIYLITPPYYALDAGEGEEVRSPLKAPNLITLIYGPSGYTQLSMLPQNFFEFTPLLRVLDLSRSGLKTFPISITELLELQYLSLSSTNIKELPEELRKLVKLKFLDLSGMLFLMTIPPGVIGSLLELRVLNLFGSYKAVDWDIEEVSKLKHLNDLGIAMNTENSTLTKLLSSSNKNLQMCTRHLSIDNSVLFDQQSEDNPQSTELKLQLLFNLETLKLWYIHMGIEQQQQQQQHLGSSCFQKLVEIVIWQCKGLKDLTWVGYVPYLKILSVVGCQELKEIVILVDDDLEGKKIIFKSLKNLRLSSLPKLKSICSHALAFPCLEYLEVAHCGQLKKLPFDSGSNPNNTLREILTGKKWLSELQWEEEEDHNNELKSKFLPYFVCGIFEGHDFHRW